MIGRSSVGVLGGADLADHERVVGGVLKLGLSAGRANEVAHPLPGAPHVLRMRGVGADAGDAEQLEELLHPDLQAVRHDGGV